MTTPIIKWRTTEFNIAIDRVECTKETENCVWYCRYGGKLSRNDKETKHEKIHDSWEDARKYLFSRISYDIGVCQKTMYALQKDRAAIIGMRNPDEV